ncbi:hypothetical protein M514_18641 [Trichuris suis]|uniref:Uncharacterized protein n=1 Tax=Trichuris suis TaxID=68888 RepID=A0A085NIH6_9BILA|nr:hypothetical protein M514_18641 [Trichuris suis]
MHMEDKFKIKINSPLFIIRLIMAHLEKVMTIRYDQHTDACSTQILWLKPSKLILENIHKHDQHKHRCN